MVPWDGHTPGTSLQDSLAVRLHPNKEVRVQGGAVGAHVPATLCTCPGLGLAARWPGGREGVGGGGYSSLTSFLCQLVRNRFPEGHGAERKKGLCPYVSVCALMNAQGQSWGLLGICSWSQRKEHHSTEVSGQGKLHC